MGNGCKFLLPLFLLFHFLLFFLFLFFLSESAHDNSAVHCTRHWDTKTSQGSHPRVRTCGLAGGEPRRKAINFFFSFLGLHLYHMKAPGLWVTLELQLPAYTTVMAMPDLSRICNLCQSLWQHPILNPPSEAWD